MNRRMIWWAALLIGMAVGLIYHVRDRQIDDGWLVQPRSLRAVKSVDAEWTKIIFSDGSLEFSYDLVGPPGVYECAIHKGCWIVQETDTTSN